MSPAERKDVFGWGKVHGGKVFGKSFVPESFSDVRIVSLNKVINHIKFNKVMENANTFDYCVTFRKNGIGAHDGQTFFRSLEAAFRFLNDSHFDEIVKVVKQYYHKKCFVRSEIVFEKVC